MKGRLIKIDDQWKVLRIGHPVDVLEGIDNIVNYIPLHPDNIIQIEYFSKHIDNMEERINAYPDVEFILDADYAKIWVAGVLGCVYPCCYCEDDEIIDCKNKK